MSNVSPPPAIPTTAGGSGNTSSSVIDFKLPPPSTKLRIRPAAHLANEDYKYVAEFNRAIELMKALPDDDPRSFHKQAAVLSAYFDHPDHELQVHSSWLFLPFHRLYLYFFEKICGELVQDPDFAIPFWNWDAPDGMQIPDIYTDKKSPLYDPLRDAMHQPPALVNLDFNGHDEIISRSEQVSNNLVTMYKHMVSGARTARLFMGDRYGAGSIERVPHNTVHDWTGDRTQPNHEDMGFLYTAARDPIFYGHHANVDRMWSVWKTLGRRNRDFTDKDWLDSSFVFYNEKAEMVRVKVRHCLDTEKLGYVYQDVEIPWLNNKPPPSLKRVVRADEKLAAAFAKDVFPTSLNKAIKVLVPRPKKLRNKNVKDDEEEEILVVEGIQLKRDVFVKFDVFVNDLDDYEGMTGTNKPEYAGSFVHVTHKDNHGENIKTKLSLGITELLGELDIEGDDNIMVFLVPKSGGNDISITGIKIEFDY